MSDHCTDWCTDHKRDTDTCRHVEVIESPVDGVGPTTVVVSRSQGYSGIALHRPGCAPDTFPPQGGQVSVREAVALAEALIRAAALVTAEAGELACSRCGEPTPYPADALAEWGGLCMACFGQVNVARARERRQRVHLVTGTGA